MKKHLQLIVLALLLCLNMAKAQSTANYALTTTGTGSLITMTGSTQIVGANLDDNASALTNIGFDFWFMGVRYSQFSASSNGAIRLGAAISTTAYGNAFPYPNAPIIAPFLGDLGTSSTGKVHYVLIGAAPNRTLVVEFLNMKQNYSSTTVDGTFQILLNESTGIIQYIYGTMGINGNTTAGATSTTVAIGFCSNNAANACMSIAHSPSYATNTTATPTTVNYTTNGVSITGLTSASNTTRRQFTFTPLVPNSPTGLNITAIASSSMTLNWTDIAGELGYVIYSSLDNINFSFVAQTAANTITYNSSGLSGGTTYYWKVYAVSEGALSTTATSASAITNAGPCTTPTATATSLLLASSSTSIAGSFTASASANSYLVLRSQLNTAPTAIVNGIGYTAGTFIYSSYFVESTGTSLTFNSTGLTPNTQYYYYIYAYNEGACTGGPIYRTSSILTGNVSTTSAVCTVPTAQGSGLNLVPTSSSISGSFYTTASATNYLVIATNTATAPSNPVNGTSYSVGPGLGGYIASISNTNIFNVSGLIANTRYWFWVFAYNSTACTGGAQYNTVSPLTGNVYTLCAPPSNSPTGLGLTAAINSIALNFSANTGAIPASGYLIIRTATSAAPSNPIDGVNYVNGTNVLGGYVETNTPLTTYNSTGLLSNTQYWYWVFAYKTCAGSTTYNTSSLANSGTTLSTLCIAPIAPVTGLTLTAYSNAIGGSFTASATAKRYLIISTTTATPPAAPVNGTTYTVGSAALGGIIQSFSSSNSFTTSSILTASTPYWIWVYPANAVTCTGTPMYYALTPANATITTLGCGVGPANTAIITAMGINNYNWNSLAWSFGHPPTACENAEIILDRPYVYNNLDTFVNITPPATVNIKSFYLTDKSMANSLNLLNINGTSTFNIDGNLIVTAPGGYKFNRCGMSNIGTTTITGNVVLGRPIALTSTTEGMSFIGSGNLTTPDQTYTMYGDMIFNPRGYTTDEFAVFAFNKAGTQYIVNNTRPIITDTVAPVLFEDLRIGTTNVTNVIFSGTNYDGYIEFAGRRGVTIAANSILDLPANYSLNVFSGGKTSYFTMLSGSKLRLGGDRSLPDPFGGVFGVLGSNYPNSFYPNNFDATSTIEYYGSNAITQTIFAGVAYANLVTTNGSGVGSGRAPKITTSPITVNTSFSIGGSSDVTLGILGSKNCPVNNAGPLNLAAGATTALGGGLYCNANIVSGSGTFSMGNYSTLGLGHPQGIVTTGSFGNIQLSGARAYNTPLGNYVYNGIVNQITGAGLPAIINEFTVDNALVVTNSQNVQVNDNALMKKGVYDLLSTTFISNGVAGVINQVTGQMKADAATVQMAGTSGTAQLISGNLFVNKVVSTLIDANTKGLTIAAPTADTVLVSTALLYGSSTTNSIITTNNNLTLLSRAAKTARFGEIVLGSGNTIAGTVNVERFIPNTRKWRLLAWPTISTQTAQQSWMEGSLAQNDNLKPGYGCIVTDEQTNWFTRKFDSRSISGPSVKYYDVVNDKYIGIPNTDLYAMNTNSAYYIYVRGDRTALPTPYTNSNTVLRTKGTLLTGTVNYPVTDGKYAAIGNPFASPIDLKKMVGTKLADFIYLWDPKITGMYGLGAYQVLTKSGGGVYRIMPGGGSYPPALSQIDTIESGMGMFVRSKGTGAGNVAFSEDAKTISARSLSRAAGTDQAEVCYALLSIVDPTENTLVDGAMVAFDDAYSSGVDYDDATKFTNTSENVSFKRQNTLLAIERRKDVVVDDTLYLNATGLRIKNYQWAVNVAHMTNPGRTAFFIDKFLNTSTALDLEGATNILFDVTSQAATYAADRFMIVFKQIPSATSMYATISAVRNADKTVKVIWGVANESFTNNYDIQQSSDGINFARIGTQQALLNNNSNTAYSYNDNAALLSNNWYRIKLNANNGTATYSSIAMVNGINAEVVIVKEAKISIYPNPVVNGTANVVFENQPKGNYAISITNKAGQLLQSKTISISTNNFVSNIKLNNAAVGSYQATVIDNEGVKTTMPFVIK